MKRIIGLIDMDCFYAQVEQRDKPELWGKPVIVVQHTRAGVQGGILAVSYEAREFGVKRGMPVADAKAICKNLNVAHVPIGEYADKADIQKYRDASAEVFDVLHNFDTDIVVEKASVDEAFLDLSEYVARFMKDFDRMVELEMPHPLEALPTSHIADGDDEKENGDDRVMRISKFIQECKYDDDQLRLYIAAITIEKIRARIREKTQFYCSAGVGNNKMMAKLVCARHKPRQQTIIPWKNVKEILRTTPIKDIRGFGGKMGNKIRELLDITMMGEIHEVPFDTLIETFPDQHEWLRSVANGYDDEPVKLRAESSSIAVSKNFPGRNAITTVKELREWLEGLTKELAKRLAADQIQNKRTAENLVFSIQTADGKPQKTLKIATYHPDHLIEQLWKAIKPHNKAQGSDELWEPKIYNISLGASRFQPGLPAKLMDIAEWMKKKKPASRFIPNVDMPGYTGDDDDIMVLEEKCVASTSQATENIITLDDDDRHPEPPKKPELDEWGHPYIYVDGKRFSRAAFRQLPAQIKKQYEHRLALQSARELKSKTTTSTTTTASKTSRKRGGNHGNSENDVKKSKPLTSFFKKK